MKPLLPLATLLLLSPLLCAHAQQIPDKPAPPTVNPYRPTVTDPALLTQPGYLQVEIGGASQRGGFGTHTAFSTPTVLQITDNSKRVEYLLSFGGYAQQNPIGANRQSGRGDTTPGVQYLIVPDKPGAYSIAARAQWKIPSATRGLGSGKTDYSLLLLASKDYSKTLHADYNFGIYEQGRASGSGFASQYQLSGAFSTSLTKNLNLQDELYGYSGNSEGPTIVSTLHALGYQVSPALAVDAGIDIGLSHAAPHYTFVFGTTFLAGRLF